MRYVFCRLDEHVEETKSNLEIKAFDAEKTQAKFDLMITINEGKDIMFGDFEYESSVLSEDSAAIMLEQLKAVLGVLAKSERMSFAAIKEMLVARKGLHISKKLQSTNPPAPAV